jgi:hypothetical protein
VFGTPCVLGGLGRGPSVSMWTLSRLGLAVGCGLLSRRQYRAAANAADPMGEPRAQLVAGFNFAMWLASSSSVAHPMKYRQIISYLRKVGFRPVHRLIKRHAMIAQ